MNYIIHVPREFFRKTIFDQRGPHINRHPFGKLKDLLKRNQLDYKRQGKTIAINGPKDRLQKILFYIHFSRTPYYIERTR